MATNSSHRVIMGKCCGHSSAFVFVRIFFILAGHFGFKSGICLLIGPVPVHCFSITFTSKFITSRTSLKFGQIGPRTTELAALERLE